MDDSSVKRPKTSVKPVSKAKKLTPTKKVLTPVEIEKSNREKKVVAQLPSSPVKSYDSYRLFTGLLSLSVILLVLIFVALASIISLMKKSENAYLAYNAPVQISSTPADADVYIDNHYVGITPITLYNLNLNDEVVLKLKKENYDDYTMTLDKFNVQPSYDVVLDATLSTTKTTSWSDFGLKIVSPENYTESLSLESAKCKDVKNYLVDSKRCANDSSTLSYNAKYLNFTDNNIKYSMSVRLPDSSNDCKLNTSKCINAKKIDTINLLDQSVDVYEQTINNTTVTFLQPIIKNKGSDYNSFYLEFNGENVDYKTVLNMITNNA